MKIIFLNTWHATLKEEIKNYIHQNLHTTSLFCFQEADETSRATYEDLLASSFVLYETKRLEKDGSWYTNATYVHKNLKVVETGDFFLTETNDLHLGVAGYVTVFDGEETITICNVHGIPQPGHKLDTPARLLQSKSLIDAFVDKGPVVIGGDFNLLPEAQSVKMFAEHGYRNLINDYEIKTTRNSYTFERYPDNIQYYADYAFTSPEIVVKGFIVPETVVSDHQPLELTIGIS